MATKWTRKRRLRRIQAATFVIAVAVFLYSGYRLLMIGLEYKAGSDEYKKLADEAVKILGEGSGGAAAGGAAAEGESGGAGDAGSWEAFHSRMLQENEDYVGWISIPDTAVDYPIVQYTDNDYYLAHTFAGTKNAAGALFVDCGVAGGMEGKNVIVYGHNMKDGSMFASLKKFQKQDFYEGHKQFRVNTATGFYTYEIFAVYVTSSDSDTYTVAYADNQEFMDYAGRMQKRSQYETGVTVGENDKIITLSTCVNQNVDRLVVQAKRLEASWAQ